MALLFSAMTVTAESVVVPNFSFETPGSPVVVNPPQSTTTLTDSTTVSGWIFNINGPSEYGTRSILNNFSVAGTSSGNNYAFINNDQLKTDTITSAASLGLIAGQTQYTLTVAIGNPTPKDTSGYGSTGPVSFSLLANGVAFATDSIANGAIANGTFQDFTLTFTTPGISSIIGENLTIQLAALPQSTAAEPAFDNVRLDVTLVPEPKTWALLGLGALALAGIGSKRRDRATA